MLNFGSRLKRLRKEKDISQSELASILGYSRSTIANYEQNIRLPSIEILLDIADYFSVSLDYLMERSNIRSTIQKQFENNSSSILLLINPDTGNIIDCNAAALTFYGYPEDELLSKSIYDINPLPDNEITQKIELTIKGEINQIHSQHQLASGEIRDVEISTNLINTNGSTFIGAVITDITKINRHKTELQKNINNFFKSISQIISYHIPYKQYHGKNVAKLATAIGQKMGLCPQEIKEINYAALLHDLGLLKVPPAILNKPKCLTQKELNLIQDHPCEAYQIINGIDFKRPVAEIVHQHHERLDGSGYPQGLKGNEILLEAKIIAVADVVEAMSSDRPHREGKEIKQVLADITSRAGQQYDKEIVEICTNLFKKQGFTFPYD